jgi:fibronectin type 3 domain-containing protein
VVGYNVYRSTIQGSGYSQINTVLNATTTYSDSQVSAGATYFYVATAVDGSGTESTYSNEVRVTVPTP